jgi:NADH dehydrogenase FAD-containing subunit
VTRPRIVIVGAGFAGFRAARDLIRQAAGRADVVLINPTDYFLYLPLLPEVAVGILEPRRLTVSPAAALPGVRFVLGDVDQVDMAGRRLGWRDPEGRRGGVRYDRLVLAAGSVNNCCPSPGCAHSWWSSCRDSTRSCRAWPRQSYAGGVSTFGSALRSPATSPPRTGRPAEAVSTPGLGFVVDLGGRDAAANPLGWPLSGLAAKAVTRDYHVLGLPGNRIRVAGDWLLDAMLPRQSVQLGLVRGDAFHSTRPRPRRQPPPTASGRPADPGVRDVLRRDR